ncbi:helix-turn-helix domain-containing protein [Fodinicola acaciae]|uniref:helix-turn-helix domain-containing protein n=1 Tax=Fodinicola acaciae TaxID=2681555 RepID=UPI0013D0882F|nr:helix-turn-helix transcriptional regulator [Fodinicola acaciae]
MASNAAAATALARRLKALRTGRGIKQAQLANVMGVSGPLISAWENADNPTPPPVERLKTYAELFASTRSADARRWQPVPVADLTGEELARRDELEAELLELRATATGEAPPATPTEINQIGGGPWRFPDGENVTIVCAQLPDDIRGKMPYADPADPDYVRLYDYADLDSLVELFGHVRATNPNANVRFKLANHLSEDDYTTHLIMLGGVDWNVVTRQLLRSLPLPVRQARREDDTAEAAFEVRTDDGVTRFSPQFDADERRTLRADVAQFVRGLNPFNRKRTVTICNGMYGQGTYGAVRALTDVRFRDRNGAYIASEFPAAWTYSLLFRVGIFEAIALTPDWTAPGTVLHKWSEPPNA